MSGTSAFARIGRIIVKIAAALIALIFLIILGSFLANFFDPPLTAQAKALLAVPPNPYKSTENIYSAMTEFESASDRFVGDLNLGAPRVDSIWSTTKTHRAQIAAALAANSKLYERYLSLHDLDGYYETARPSWAGTMIMLPQPLRVLFLADIANRIQTGNGEQQRAALADLKRDLELWRSVIRGEGSLVYKMVALGSLHADYALLADLITDAAGDTNSLMDSLEPVVTTLQLEDYRIGHAFAVEFRQTSAMLRTINTAEPAAAEGPSGWPRRLANAFQSHFFKQNATENENAELASLNIALGNSEPGQFEQKQRAYDEWLKAHGPRLSPAYLYNPVGKILVSVGASGLEKGGYALRAFDVAAYQRLVHLTLQLIHGHVAPADVGAFMKAHPEWATHPVDGKTFDWDPETRKLAVNTLSPRTQPFERFGVVLP